MPSNFVNSASSLPSDYALVSSYASSRGQFDGIDNENTDALCLPEDTRVETMSTTLHGTLREDALDTPKDSSASQQFRPNNPRLATLPVFINRMRSRASSSLLHPSEGTSLLGSSTGDGVIPSHELTPSEASATCTGVRQYWEECKILIEYTMPVLGSVFEELL